MPSAAIRAASRPAWSAASRPMAALASVAVDVGDGLGDPLAEVAGLVAVSQLDRLVGAGAGPRGDRRPADRAAARVTSTSTVGLPRLSKISRPSTAAMGAWGLLIGASRFLQEVANRPRPSAGARRNPTRRRARGQASGLTQGRGRSSNSRVGLDHSALRTIPLPRCVSTHLTSTWHSVLSPPVGGRQIARRSRPFHFPASERDRAVA